MKTNLFISFFAFAMLFAFATPVAAQDEVDAEEEEEVEEEESSDLFMKHRNQLSLNIAEPGFGSVMYAGDYDWKNPFGGTYGFGLNYTVWFNHHVGFNTGLNFSYMFHAEDLEGGITTKLLGTLSFFNGTDYEYKQVRMTANTPKVHEHQAFFMLEVPIQLAFQSRHLFGNIGFSFATPITTYGTYTYNGSEYLIDEIPGLGTYDLPYALEAVVKEGNEGDYYPADVKRPFFVDLSVDLGWKFDFDHKNSLALSLYCNYSLNKCKINDSLFDVIYVNNDESHATPPMECGLVQEYRYFNAGIRIAYHIGLGKLLQR